MKKTKVYIKLVDVTHIEWRPIMAEFLYKFCTSMSFNKDTYWCNVTEEQKDFLLSVQKEFSERGKTILIG